MNSEERSKKSTNWFGVIAAGAVAVGGALALAELSHEKNELCKKLENNKSECDNKFVEAKYLSPEIGDLVEIKRDIYSHWGIYVGSGYIINLVDSVDGKAKILKQKIVDVAANNLCRVNNLERAANRRQLKAKYPEDILETATQLLNKVINFDLLASNCEHFATYCRYGVGFSEQSIASKNSPIIETVASHIARSAPQSALSIARAANYSSHQ